jgi:inner membrane protein
MPTVYTYAVVGLGLGKVFTSRPMPPLFWVLAGLLPMVPDFDSFFTYAYGSTLGHRGFTHSLTFALVLGLAAAALTFRRLGISLWDLWGFFFVITASHGILDAFTNGGFGIPLFWPFDSARYGPWGPVQVSDLGFEIPNPRTSRTVRTELLWIWLPTIMLVAAVMGYRRWRRRRLAISRE